MNILRTAQQIKQNPNMLASILQRQGMISEQQVKEIQKMGSNYEQVGRYLISNGRIPENVQPFENQVNQVQNMMQGRQ